MKEINVLLKMRCIETGITAKMLANEMQISESQFNRKINKKKTGSSYQNFTYCEKFYIAYRLNMQTEDIE